MISRVFVSLILMLAGFPPASSQTGGPYDLSHNVIASGGGSQSVGGSLSVDGSVGQNWAGGVSAGGGQSVRSGFWAYTLLLPTAAGVSISGQIRTSNGAGIQGVSLLLTNASTGAIFIARSTSFGYYRFDDIPVGQAYLLSISSRRYVFDPSERLIVLRDELNGEDFVALAE